MDVSLINPFLVTIKNVLLTMAQIQGQEGRPFLKKDRIARGDVTGIIGLAGNMAKGSLAISFSESAMMEIAGRMLPKGVDGLGQEAADLAAEITKMVSGGARKILAERGYRFKLAIPTTVVGKNHTIKHFADTPVVVVPFQTEFGPFYVEICMAKAPADMI